MAAVVLSEDDDAMPPVVPAATAVAVLVADGRRICDGVVRGGVDVVNVSEVEERLRDGEGVLNTLDKLPCRCLGVCNVLGFFPLIFINCDALADNKGRCSSAARPSAVFPLLSDRAISMWLLLERGDTVTNTVGLLISSALSMSMPGERALSERRFNS